MDLIQNAINKGFHPENEKYYLWEIQKWLREKHNIVVYILPHAPQKRIDSKINLYSACLWYKNEYQSEIASFKTYEQALEKGLQEALKLI